MSDSTLQIVLDGCLQNNRKCQEQLYQRFFAYGMSICLRYTVREEEAIEVLNNSFMKVFSHLQQFDRQKPFHAWFRKILINTAINYYHKNKKYREQYQPMDEGQEVAVEPDILGQFTYQEIISTIQQLSPVYRTVFNLFVIDGYSHEEIAEALHITVGASKSNLSRARANLRFLLKKSHEACKV